MSDSGRPAPPPINLSESPTSQARAARRRGPWRWLVALGATGALVLAGSGLVAFAQTGGGPTAGPSFMPADTPIYLEVRADLPSGQDEALAQMMTAFPGFADAATFDMKVNEALKGFVAQATQGALDWTADIEPWFDGQISIGITDLENLQATSDGTVDLPLILGLTVKDPAAFDATIQKLMEAGGSDAATSTTTYEYDGSTITVAPDLAFTVSGDQVIASNDVAQVKLALDVLAGKEPSLASDPSFQAAIARVPDAHVGAGYIRFDAFKPLIEQGLAAAQSGALEGMDSSGTLQGLAGMGLDPAAVAAMLPVDATFYAAVRPDGATFETFVTPAEGTAGLTMGESDLAASFPASTQLYLEARDLGGSVKTALEALVAQMGDQSTDLQGFEQMLGTPLQDILAWAGDASVGAALDGSELWVGLVADVTDTKTATQLLTGVTALAGALAMQSDGAVTTSSSTVDGVSVTTFTLDPSALGDQPLPLPIDTSLSVALDGDRLLLGTGSFVEAALGTTPETSLQSVAGYQEAVGALGTPNGGYLYLDIAGLRTAFEPLLQIAMPDYASIAPMVEPFGRLVAGTRVVDDTIQALTVQLYLD